MEGESHLKILNAGQVKDQKEHITQQELKRIRSCHTIQQLQKMRLQILNRASNGPQVQVSQFQIADIGQKKQNALNKIRARYGENTPKIIRSVLTTPFQKSQESAFECYNVYNPNFKKFLKRHLKRRKISKFKITEKSRDPITQAALPYDSQFSVPSFRMLDQIPVPAASVLNQVKKLHDVKIIKIKSAKIRKSQPLNQEIFRVIGVQETKKSSDSPLLRFGSMLAKQQSKVGSLMRIDQSFQASQKQYFQTGTNLTKSLDVFPQPIQFKTRITPSSSQVLFRKSRFMNGQQVQTTQTVCSNCQNPLSTIDATVEAQKDFDSFEVPGKLTVEPNVQHQLLESSFQTRYRDSAASEYFKFYKSIQQDQPQRRVLGSLMIKKVF